MSSNTAIHPIHSQFNPVSWQTAYWTLVPLAISTMTQPSGRICGHSSRHRTYIRALPLLCAFDVLSIALRLVHQQCFSRRSTSIRRSLDSIFRARFVDVVACEDGIQNLENFTVLRWVFFIIGTAPPAVKIMAMSGLPWTKAWAMMYLISFLVVEAMVVLRKNEEPLDSSFDPLAQEEADDSHEHRQMRQLSSVTALIPTSDSTFNQAIDTICFFSALILQITILAWALLDIWPGSEDTTALSTALRLTYGTLMSVVAVVAGAGAASGSFFPILALLISCIPLVRRTYRRLLNRHVASSTESWLGDSDDGALSLGMPITIVITCLFIWIPVSIWTLSSFARMAETPFLGPKELFADIGLVITVVFAILLQYQIITHVGRQWPLLGRNLLVRSQNIGSFHRDGSPWEYLDTEASWWLTCFLTSFIICTLWYSNRYNPSETINPDWTGIFG